MGLFFLSSFEKWGREQMINLKSPFDVTYGGWDVGGSSGRGLRRRGAESGAIYFISR